MNLKTHAVAASLALACFGAMAQNIATVNGKAVPKARVDALLTQAQRSGQQLPPDIEKRARDAVVMQEIFAQEAERRGLAASPDYRSQMELARQRILLDLLRADVEKKAAVSDADVKTEYEKFKAQQPAGTEYRARHILVEKEDEAKALLVQLKGGAKFDELAKKHSKDPGSGQNGGDLDWANGGSYVPEFTQAMTKLKKGETTDTPVKSQFGFHIIKLEDTREAQVPSLDELKPQILQSLKQGQMQKFQEDLKSKAKTDYKF